MLLTAKQVASILNVSVRQVYRMNLPIIRLGERCYRFHPDDVDAAMVRECQSRGLPREAVGVLRLPAKAVVDGDTTYKKRKHLCVRRRVSKKYGLRWEAKIRRNGCEFYLGTYNTYAEAISAYDSSPHRTP